MQTEYDYSVIRPEVDKSKLRELVYMIKGEVAPTIRIRKPTLYLRKINTNTNTRSNGNIQNVYGNNVQPWRTQAQTQIQIQTQTLGASSSYNNNRRPSPGDIAVRRRREKETKTALRELGRMVRGY